VGIINYFNNARNIMPWLKDTETFKKNNEKQQK